MKNKIHAIVTFMSLMVLYSCETYDMDEPGNLLPKTVDEDPLLPRIEVNGTILHSEAFGDIQNPIMIFLHGGPGSDYRSMISEKGYENANRYPNERTTVPMGLSKLRDEYYCVFYDQRGAGLSPRFEKAKLTFAIYLEDLKAVIERTIKEKLNTTGIKDERVYLFGYSFGGLLANGFINKYPGLVKHVVFYEPAPFTKENWEYFVENSSMVFAQIGKEWLDEYLLAHEHFTPNDHIQADYQMLLVANRAQPEFHEEENNPFWRYGSLTGSANLDFGMSDNFDVTSNLSSFSGNALFISGSLSMHEYSEYLEMQSVFYNRSEEFIIEGIGHSGVWQKPDEIIKIIKSTIKP